MPPVRLARAVATTGTRPRRRDASPDSARSVGGSARATRTVAAQASRTGVAASRRSTPPVAVCTSPRPRVETRAAAAIATSASSPVRRRTRRRPSARSRSARLAGSRRPVHAPATTTAAAIAGATAATTHDHRCRHPAAPRVGRDQPGERGAHGGGQGDERHALRQRAQGDRGDRRPAGTLGEQERLAPDHEQPCGQDERERPHRRETDEQHRRLGGRPEEAGVGGAQHPVQRAVDRRRAPVGPRQRSGLGDDLRHGTRDLAGVGGAQRGRDGREPEGRADRLGRLHREHRVGQRGVRGEEASDPENLGGGRRGLQVEEVRRTSTTPATWRRRARTDRSRRPRRRRGSAR